ncbi:MAG: response regulator transcription factor [Bdellovibrionaceae bacterium]|nr:response regulator transcription factor [Pseudobdellovibrionaceae bacterium]
MRVLIIEDDQKIVQMLVKGFAEAGFNPQASNTGTEGLALAQSEQFDLLIVDVMLPGVDGFSLVSELRKTQSSTPVIFLSAKRSTEDRIEGLQRGGDDYMVKPFSFSELLARAQAVLRRTAKTPESNKLTFEDLELDLLSRTVRRSGQKIELHQKEFALLECLLRDRERVLTKTQILEKVWSYDFDPQTNVVDVLVCRLRAKIDKGFGKKLIQTIRGVGYALRVH